MEGRPMPVNPSARKPGEDWVAIVRKMDPRRIPDIRVRTLSTAWRLHDGCGRSYCRSPNSSEARKAASDEAYGERTGAGLGRGRPRHAPALGYSRSPRSQRNEIRLWAGTLWC